jgi:hypothetical protein
LIDQTVSGSAIATSELLQTAIQSAFTNSEPYFANIWTEFTGTNPSEVAAGQNLLLALARGTSRPNTLDISTIAARRRLLRYHVIESPENNTTSLNFDDPSPNISGDRIEIPLFEQWVKERAIRI